MRRVIFTPAGRDELIATRAANGEFKSKRGKAMNLREGTRRTGLALGSGGAIVGGFASVSELQTVPAQSERHNKFKQFANSDVVRQERTTLQADEYSTPIPPGATLGQPVDGTFVTNPEYIPPPVDINSGGIRTIHWAKDFGIFSIETVDGETIFPTPPPVAWAYGLVVLFPIL